MGPSTSSCVGMSNRSNAGDPAPRYFYNGVSEYGPMCLCERHALEYRARGLMIGEWPRAKDHQ